MHKIERKQIGATASLNTIFVSTAQAWPMSQIPLMQARAHLVQVRITLQTFWSKKLTRVPENKPCFVFPDFLSLLPPELLVTILSFLKPKDVVAVASTSSALRSIALSSAVWRPLVQQHHQHCLESPSLDENYYITYKTALTTSRVAQEVHSKTVNDLARALTATTNQLNSTTQRTGALQTELHRTKEQLKNAESQQKMLF